MDFSASSQKHDGNYLRLTITIVQHSFPSIRNSTDLPAKSDSDLMFCLQSYSPSSKRDWAVLSKDTPMDISI